MVERSIFGPKINIWQKRIFPKPPYFILHNFSCMVISASTFRPVIITIRFKWKIIYPFKISAKAGIQFMQEDPDSCLRRSGGFSEFLGVHPV